MIRLPRSYCSDPISGPSENPKGFTVIKEFEFLGEV